MDLHVDLLAKVEKALSEEKKANEARRGFMKYVFTTLTHTCTFHFIIHLITPLDLHPLILLLTLLTPPSHRPVGIFFTKLEHP